jgi:hypothetical protein
MLQVLHLGVSKVYRCCISLLAFCCLTSISPPPPGAGLGIRRRRPLFLMLVTFGAMQALRGRAKQSVCMGVRTSER